MIGLGLAAVIAAGLGLWITAPARVDAARFGSVTGTAEAGQTVFLASGCASCHHAPGSEDKLLLAGGERFDSDFGTFVAPNISSDPVHGIGAWSLEDFANAVLTGVSPEGRHYYPAFPYASYAGMTAQDLADLWAYMQTLPASDAPSQPHALAFPFNIRRSVGGWKWLFLQDGPVVEQAATPELERGRYLVEVLAHCGECHTPRGALGALDTAAWLTGAPNPSGRGRIPSLRAPDFGWNASDIAYYLETGFTPDFDSAGGSMAAVVTNFGQLSAEDRNAVAAYIKALPPL